jgi:hypothetical protein
MHDFFNRKSYTSLSNTGRFWENFSTPILFVLIQFFEIYLKIFEVFFLNSSFLEYLVLYPSLDLPNIYNFSDKNSPKSEETSHTLRFILASTAMCSYWQNALCVLSFVTLKWRMRGGKPPPISYKHYFPDLFRVLFAARSFCVFVFSNRLEALNLFREPHLQRYIRLTASYYIPQY